MADNVRERLREARQFLADGMWRSEFEPKTWASRGVRLLQFTSMVGEGFVRDQLLLRASALTYFSVLSLVPVLAIVGSIAPAAGASAHLVGGLVAQLPARRPLLASPLSRSTARRSAMSRHSSMSSPVSTLSLSGVTPRPSFWLRAGVSQRAIET